MFYWYKKYQAVYLCTHIFIDLFCNTLESELLDQKVVNALKAFDTRATLSSPKETTFKSCVCKCLVLEGLNMHQSIINDSC